MRMMMKINIPVKSGNAAAREGKLGSTIQSILDELKPEAAYFTDDKGKRTAFLFINIESSSEIPKIAEPWFLAFNAEVELHPAMDPEDLEKAGPWIAEAVNTYS